MIDFEVPWKTVSSVKWNNKRFGIDDARMQRLRQDAETAESKRCSQLESTVWLNPWGQQRNLRANVAMLSQVDLSPAEWHVTRQLHHVTAEPRYVLRHHSRIARLIRRMQCQVPHAIGLGIPPVPVLQLPPRTGRLSMSESFSIYTGVSLNQDQNAFK
jgi:hypothetical protein